jgi:hypothetical protein
MATNDWLAQDATSGGSQKTHRLKEVIAAQRRRLPGAQSELSKIVVSFWTGKIEVDAVALNDGDKSVRVYVADISIEIANLVCQNFRTRPAQRMSACCVKGANLVCVVLGADTPPENLDMWIVSHIERLDPATTV